MRAVHPERSLFIALGVIFLIGTFLRLPDDLFRGEHAPLRTIAALHPQPKWDRVGFDEGLYRAYVNDVIQYGVTAYPDLADRYVEVQSRLPSAILPPTRFLYVFCAYIWNRLTGLDPLTSLHHVSSVFSILLLAVAAIFACRLGGLRIGVCVTALFAVAPTQLHMSQHALIDGFFAFWAVGCLWLLWENLQRRNDWRWLVPYALCLALMVLTKENAMFAYIGLLSLLAANPWLKFGQISRYLLLMTFVGPLLGTALLVNLCGSVETAIQVYMLLVSKASVLPYAVATGDGPWHRYLVDLLLVSPVVLLLAVGGVFLLRREDKSALYQLVFVATSYLLMANVRYGMNLRYTNMWDLPLRFLAVTALLRVFTPWRLGPVLLGGSVALICALEFRQYVLLFVEHDLYELVTEGLLRALRILK